MSALTLTERIAPSAPTAGKHVLYIKADGLIYYKNAAGVETQIATLAGLDLKQSLSEKGASNGYVGLTLLKINFRNVLNTFVSFFTNSNTAARTYTFPDKDLTVAGLVDFAAPPAIGNTTPAAGTFTTLKANADSIIGPGAPLSYGVNSRWLTLDSDAVSNETGGLIAAANGVRKGCFYAEIAAANLVFDAIAGYSVAFYANAAVTPQLKVKAAGVDVLGLLDLSAATSGQIKFPATQNPSANVNTLDDYEEGTWTPAFSPATGTIALAAISACVYTKIGRMVKLNGYIQAGAVSAPTGKLTITGLPFIVSGSDSGVALWAGGFAATAVAMIMGYPNTTTATLILEKYSAGAAANLAGDVILGAGFTFSCTYTTT